MAESHLVHVICGSTGAGKTTYALQLSERLRAIRFSIDEWMSALFWMDSPQPLDPAWSLERIERCWSQIASVAVQATRSGTPCILDLGFTDRRSRARAFALARDAGVPARLHFVDVPAAERWARVQRRNADDGPTRQLAFAVTREMFDFVESRWEPPTSAEMLDHDGVRYPEG